MPLVPSQPRRVRRALLTAAIAGAAALGAAPGAGAAVVVQEGDALVYRAAPGELNRVHLNGSWDPEGRVRFTDLTADITAFPETCTRRDIDMVDCDVPGRVRVELGDGDDAAGFMEAWSFAIPVHLDGGAGSDRLDGDHEDDRPELLTGGPGKDVLSGFGGDDELLGGPGDDDLEGRAGNDRVLGEDGNDTLSGDGQATPGADLVDGGAGSDIVKEYVEYATDIHPPANILLNGAADDGRDGEGDNVVSIERYIAYVSGRFELSDGPEDWQVWSNMNSGESDVLARGGDDVVTGGDAIERIDGGTGNDRLEGGKNHDTLTGGPGEDLLYGDETTTSCKPDYPESCVRYGNDVIYARDGQVDGIDCGAGMDRVEADANDVIAQNCETVDRGGSNVDDKDNDKDPDKVDDKQDVDQVDDAQPRMTVSKPKLRTALSRGLVVKLFGAKPGKASVVARHGRKVVARGSTTVKAGVPATVKVRFTKAGRRALRSKRKVTLKLSGGDLKLTLRLAR